MVILLECMKVDPISNNLIQIIYLVFDKDRALGNEYFNNMSILFVQNYEVDDLNKCIEKRFLKISCIYFNAHIIIIEDRANNGNYYLIKYLKSSSLLRLPLFSLELKIRCFITLLQKFSLHQGLCNGSHLIIM